MQAQDHEGKPVRIKHKALDVDEKWVHFVDESISASELHSTRCSRSRVA